MLTTCFLLPSLNPDVRLIMPGYSYPFPCNICLGHPAVPGNGEDMPNEEEEPFEDYSDDDFISEDSGYDGSDQEEGEEEE